MGFHRGWAFVVVAACGPAVADPDDGSGTGTDGGTTAPSTSASTTEPGTTAPTTSVGEVTGTVTTVTGPVDTGSSADDSCPPDENEDEGPHFDIGPPLPECDLFAQDCKEGFKCVPDGYSTRICVPLDPAPVPDGEACDAAFDADPCGPSSWCWPGSNTCVPMCTGSARDPICPPDTICVMDDEGITAVCQRPCDPFETTCPRFMACQPTDQGFGCLPAGNEQSGEFCHEQDSCGAGLACIPGEEAGCCSSQCCMPLCSLEHPCESGGPCVGLNSPGPDGIGYCGPLFGR